MRECAGTNKNRHSGAPPALAPPPSLSLNLPPPPSRPSSHPGCPSHLSQPVSLLRLYRRLMRSHAASLPPPLRALGDKTARSEWKAMAAASARAEGQDGRPDRAAWELFATSWASYVDALAAPPGGSGAASPASGDLSPADIEALSPDQRARLRRLAAAAGELAKGMEEEEGAPPPPPPGGKEG